MVILSAWCILPAKQRIQEWPHSIAETEFMARRMRQSGESNLNDRTFRLIFGALLLLALYFDLNYVMYSLIGILLLEGITNWRITLIIRKIRGIRTIDESSDNLAPIQHKYRFNFEAERAWRLFAASMLVITYVLFYDLLWFFPWFMGFAIFGAGISGVCPVLTGIKWIGCR
jgi:hypothetical protein